MSRTSILGGETKSRGLLSGRKSRGTVALWVCAAIVSCVLVLFLQLFGVLIVLPLLATVFVLTLDSGTGSTPWRRISDRRRMKWRRKQGFDDFVPVDFRPPSLTPDEDRREWNRYRDVPDGVDGLYWLQSGPGLPAVAYHSPVGETPYLSVAFSVDGPIRGLHGDSYVAQAQAAFGNLLAGWGASQKLVTGIQTMTRVLPTDSAYHEAWLAEHLDPTAPEDLQADYGALLDDLAAHGYVQRHFAVIRWDVDARFLAAASRRGEGLAGYLAVVNAQVPRVKARLVEAMFHRVRVLSGPQLAAVLRHLQHPGWPIDRASDVTVDTCWVPSHDEWSLTEVTAAAPDPLDPDRLLPLSSWVHRTAVIPVDAIESRELDGLWLTPLLMGLDDQVVRTVSMHVQLVPAREAKSGARRDATSDQADLLADQRKGRLVDDSAELALSAATRRWTDLRDGSGHHGVLWAGFITLSTSTLEELEVACSAIEEAADSAGIGRLDWQDTKQAAAQATTWPLARGLLAPRRTSADKALARIGSGSNKESM